ncbi:CoA transferase [Microbacterium esteraromaticum]|uniref:CoA transferase n=1 Tax=Microbacterium esteraromaticum TaxID=57043 RepID=A0A939DV16_9MICO|nr:CoA transferase [Microbacterium esteraromaticum]MBN7793280.1 CoA transferase [Microbacterium esteraromaticum]MBN8205441.1 CoA transferase [Microbacterium esteraromaticum]MBN8415595.1 CoA transferase [Microbacterium esteraromaticum]MBY6060403.1 CoA transferase [Microbacterium esteraromaticum]MCA1305604.1 CoA transferase [Microbacterium esteraromaticum]
MTGTTPTSALAGLRVIDAASLAAAPLVATYLAEFGAEVIKVEDPNAGDALRAWGVRKDGVGLMWKSVARNKKPVTANLRTSAGQELLKQLAGEADVIIFNTRPSTLEKWGLDYESLRETHPHLIYLHITAFGEGGPDTDRPGFGTLGEAMSGFAHTTGEADGPPTLPSFMLADGVASLNAVYAVLIALYHRDVRGGGGQKIDVNLVEPLARLLEQSVLTFDQLGENPARTGNRWAITVPRNTYKTQDGRWIVMSGSAPSIALRVYKAIGRPELVDDPAYADPQQRLQRADEIDAMVADWIGAHPFDDVMRIFADEQVAVAPVYDAEQLLADPHHQARGTFVRMPDADLGSMRVQAPVPRLSVTPGRVEHLGRELGADSSEIYASWLGLDEARIGELRAAGAV